ncbi:UNVERIFIED_CONTAM: hypothetical protein Slati_2511700 [Sesamum latifolium]|uniref:Uncharacterized protein n=1 Tax=Sesamum latifolium TaxID=2727402 RepID=A0AAW2WF80_9LAMI
MGPIIRADLLRVFGPQLEWAFEVEPTLGPEFLRLEISFTSKLGRGALGRIHHSVPPTLRRKERKSGPS